MEMLINNKLLLVHMMLIVGSVFFLSRDEVKFVSPKIIRSSVKPSKWIESEPRACSELGALRYQNCNYGVQ